MDCKCGPECTRCSCNNPNQPQRITRGYDDSMAGELIQGTKEVRATLGTYYRDCDDIIMERRSNLHLPTYGNCSMCLRSGPINKMCGECNHELAFYEILITRTKPEDESRVIDAEYLSGLVNSGHETAMADRVRDWVDLKRRHISQFHFMIMVRMRCQLSNDTTDARLKVQKMINDIYDGVWYRDETDTTMTDWYEGRGQDQDLSTTGVCWSK